MNAHRNISRWHFNRLWGAAGSAAILGVLALAPGAAAQRSAGPEILGDSYAEFSDVQGQNNWFYGFYDGDSGAPWTESDFEALPIFDEVEGLGSWYRAEGPGGYWTHLHVWGGHPNGVITSGGRISEENWAVRRWVSPVQQIVRVRATLRDLGFEPRVANGVVGHIICGGTLWQQTIENGPNGAVADIEFCVNVGTAVDFAIDPCAGNDWGDETYFASMIYSIIDLQPRDVTMGPGGAATFSVSLDAMNSYSFQWRKDGMPITGATQPTLTLPKIEYSDGGVYDCVIAGECGSMLSNGATLNVCSADFNRDGMINSHDVYDFLDCFFASDLRCDFNSDGFITSQDFFDFAVIFTSGCPV